MGAHTKNKIDMLIPLKQFYCDTCGEIINSPEEGWIEWISKYNEVSGLDDIHSFRIVHHYSCSPLASTKKYGCYQHTDEDGRSDVHLQDFICEEYKMANILRFLDIGSYHVPDYKGSGIVDLREYVEIVRRFTIPYYEEARQYWEEALEDGYFQDSNELWIYGVDNLKNLVEKYGDK